MKNKVISLGLAVIITTLCGCNMEKKSPMPQTFSNVSVRASYSPTVKFPPSGKYAFVQFASDDKEDPEVAMIDQRVKTALAGELKKKGYKPGEYQDINLFIVYALGLQQQIDILIGKSKVEGNEWISAVVVPNDYVNGALVVQMIDAKTMQPVWLGIFNADVTLASVSEKEKQQRVGYAVRELLKSFPPK